MERKMEIIDAHAHIYPEKIAAKATNTIGVFYDIKMDMPAGTAEKLIEVGENAGISRYIVHSVATTAHQVRSINEFIKRECEAHPEFIGFTNPEETNTGEYDDTSDLDERLWAAMELYRTTGEKHYLTDAKTLFDTLDITTEFGWGDVSGFAGWALLENILKSAPKHPRIRLSDAEQSLVDRYIKVIVQEADRLVAVSESHGYGAAMETSDYVWGSNMLLLNYGMLLATAYQLTQETKYFDAAVRQMDYLLGVNAVDYTYVTGVGTHAYEHPHNRVTEADGIDETIPGFVSGGPNRRPGDPVARENIAPGTPPMKCFLDHWSCYSLNEITIYWNSPAIFVAAFLDQIRKTQ
jgi:endoglucanase